MNGFTFGAERQLFAAGTAETPRTSWFYDEKAVPSSIR
jgi:hypothetical protein